jgi:Sec-independent protein translocase protein TatA
MNWFIVEIIGFIVGILLSFFNPTRLPGLILAIIAFIMGFLTILRNHREKIANQKKYESLKEKVDKIDAELHKEMVSEQRNKSKELSSQFPDGYQLFGVVDKKIIPYERPSSKQARIDWSTAKILQVTEDAIEIMLPDAILPGNNVLSSNRVIVKNQEGYTEGFMNIRGWVPFVEILKSNKDRIIAVLGYKFTR